MGNRISTAFATLSIALFAANAFATEGRTPGQYTVSPTGGAQYTIPIWVPPGPHGLQPQIALTYDSHSGDGPFGVGWSLSGLSSITRCNSTYAQDAAAAAVTLTYSDRFCMDGSRLRITSSGGLATYGQNLTTYQTEIANFSNVTAHGTTGNGPTYFTVQSRDGLTYEYGNGGNSQIVLSGTVNTWLLDKVTDRAGNTMTITYVAPSTNLVGTTEPSVISWTPSTYGSTSYNYTMTFAYSTTAIPSQSGYVAASAYLNSTVLSDIVIRSAGTVVKNYQLTYTPATTTSRETLTSVKECQDIGASNCLIQTAVAYQAGTAGVASPSTTTGSGATNGTMYSVDIDGDGKQDLVFATTSGSNYVWWVQLATATGYGAPINTGAVTVGTTDFLVDDFDGKGGAEILAPSGGVWNVYRFNGTSFTPTPTTVSVIANVNYTSADVDGDGLPDLVSVSKGTAGGTVNVGIQLNTGLGVTVSFATTPVTNIVTLGGVLLQNPQVFGNNQIANSSLKHLDFDGDDRQDVLIYYQRWIGTSSSYVLWPLLSRGTAAPVLQLGLVNPVPATIAVLNFNDDGCTDLVFASQLLISPCNGSTWTQLTLPAIPALALDWDGDGRTDLLANVSGVWQLYQSQGNAVAPTTPAGITLGAGNYLVTDKDGDGLDDLVFANSGASYAITYGLHNGAATPPDLLSSVTDGYGNAVTLTHVSIAQSRYTNLFDAVYPYQNFVGPFYVVSKAVFSDPSVLPGSTYNQAYYYYGGWMNLQGRGFQGFRSYSTTDTRTALYNAQYFERSFPYTGMRYQVVVSNSSVLPYEYTATPAVTTLDSTANNQRYFPYFNQVIDYYREVGGPEDGDSINARNTRYTYDNYGNATTVVVTLTDQDPGSPYTGNTWTTSTTNTTDISANQAADVAAWCLNMLDETQVVYSASLAGSTSVTRTKTFTPDTPAACRIKTAITEPTPSTNPYKATETLTFDSFGNVHTYTITGANMPSSPASRLTTLNWGTTGQFLSSIVDPSGATTTPTYSSNQSLTFGVPDSVKDANNLTTSWTYDAFGRKNKETRPDGTSTTWTRSACTSFCGWSNSVYQIAQTAYQTNGTTAIRTDTTSYDPVDRVTQSAGPTVTGATATVQKVYNSLGLLAQQSMPFLSGTPYLQTYLYDGLNRLSSVTRPISTTNSSPQSTNYFYAGRQTTVSDPNGHTTNTITDVNGWLRRATDGLGFYVTRAYDSAGSTIGVTDSAGNSLLKGVTYAYGIRPFLLAANDADRGAWSYTVDSLGELTGWTDAKGQAFSMTYDALSRALTRNEPDQFSQWTYGSTPASYNVGQLISECTGTSGACTSAGYSEARTFDSLGRLSTRAITDGTIPGNNPGGVFLFTSAYDATTGLPKTLTYPISTSGFALTVQYAYQNGLMQSVTDTSDTVGICGTTCTLWTANAMNAFGQITQETLGNGVVMNRTYDAVTSWLSRATGGVGGGAALLNQSYAQDRNGNVIQRQQNNAPAVTESFAYDADNRLTCALLSGTCTTSTLAYDGGAAGPGNITSQSGVGTYTYPAAGQPRPHAVTSLTGTFNGIVNPTFSYDANGNMTMRASATQNIYWMTSNYPASILATDATGAEGVSFAYGPDRQRVQQNYSNPSVYESTYYIGGLIDKVVVGSAIDYRHYIYAGSEPVAVYSRTAAGVNVMSYFLEDHQGGISAISSSAGTINGTTGIYESFSAFGARRNPTTWSGAPTTADLNTVASLSRQGYTFQTALGQSMGLNHMNGRVEDAILGRFLSPDPYIPNPADAQSYNRYSYVGNNPLTYTDPTGFKHCLGKSGGGCDPDEPGYATPGTYGIPQGPYFATTSSPGNAIAAFDNWLSGWRMNFSSGSDDNSTTASTELVAQGATPQGNTLPGDDPSNPNYHSYSVINLICDSSQQFGCSASYVFHEGLDRYPAPGLDGSYVQNGDTRTLPIFGNTSFIVDPDNLEITNVTEPDHLLYPGYVQRQVITAGSMVFIQTNGYGTGSLGTLNVAGAQTLWTFVDAQIANSLIGLYPPSRTRQ